LKLRDNPELIEASPRIGKPIRDALAERLARLLERIRLGPNTFLAGSLIQGEWCNRSLSSPAITITVSCQETVDLSSTVSSEMSDRGNRPEIHGAGKRHRRRKPRGKLQENGGGGGIKDHCFLIQHHLRRNYRREVDQQTLEQNFRMRLHQRQEEI